MLNENLYLRSRFNKATMNVKMIFIIKVMINVPTLSRRFIDVKLIFSK
jgi:hypothetical protein